MSQIAVGFDLIPDDAALYASPPANPPPSPFEWGRTERIRVLLGDAFELRFEAGTTTLRPGYSERRSALRKGNWPWSQGQNRENRTADINSTGFGRCRAEAYTGTEHPFRIEIRARE
jgi:hypothetical protein